MRHHPFPVTFWQSVFYVILPILSYCLIIGFALFVPKLYAQYAGNEVGVLETLHIILGLAGFVIALRLVMHYVVLKNRLGILFSILSALICFYIAGEEASYGQHFIGWEADGIFLEINDQQETNLHNTSSWLDQKPRTVLEIAIILGGLLLPLFPAIMMRVVPQGLHAYSPTLLFLPTSILVVISRIPERLNLTEMAIFPTGIRYSEVQELYLFLFIALYLYFVLRLEKARLAET